MEVTVEIVSRETIKPSSPTPTELRSFKLSLFDQINPALYTPLLLFYTDHHNGQVAPDEKLGRLKSSLSRTLSNFYPLAGRIIDNFSIECGNQGAEFIEAKFSNVSLYEILEHPNTEVLDRFLPTNIHSTDARYGPLLQVQASFFECGGLVIGLCISHKLTDASTLSTFVNTWAGEARGSSELVRPDFRLSTMFPTVDYLRQVPTLKIPRTSCITRRFVIESSRIAALKARAASDDVKLPTSVEAVSALVWRSTAMASRRNSGAGSGLKPTVLSQVVNLRKRVNPPLPDNSAGNMVGFFPAKADDGELELSKLVYLLRKGIEDYQRHSVEQFVGEGWAAAILKAAADYGALIVNQQVEFYSCSSWCKFPLYTADFGWGKPTWASVASAEYKNSIMLINTPDGEGIEAWLTLTEADMALVERDHELLEFAAVNPSIDY